VVSAVLKLDVLLPDYLLFILAVACAEGWSSVFVVNVFSQSCEERLLDS